MIILAKLPPFSFSDEFPLIGQGNEVAIARTGDDVKSAPPSLVAAQEALENKYPASFLSASNTNTTSKKLVAAESVTDTTTESLGEIFEGWSATGPLDAYTKYSISSFTREKDGTGSQMITAEQPGVGISRNFKGLDPTKTYQAEAWVYVEKGGAQVGINDQTTPTKTTAEWVNLISQPFTKVSDINLYLTTSEEDTVFFVDGVSVKESAEGPESVPVINISASRSSIGYGDNVFITWSISGATSCNTTHSAPNQQPRWMQQQVGNTTDGYFDSEMIMSGGGTYVYGIECNGPGGSSLNYVEVNLEPSVSEFLCEASYGNNDPCSVDNMRLFWQGDELNAYRASIICHRESGSNARMQYKSSEEYSFGLFQINTREWYQGCLDGPQGPYDPNRDNGAPFRNYSCDQGGGGPPGNISNLNDLKSPDSNRLKAKRLFELAGNNWDYWSTARPYPYGCDIYNQFPQSTPTPIPPTPTPHTITFSGQFICNNTLIANVPGISADMTISVGTQSRTYTQSVGSVNLSGDWWLDYSAMAQYPRSLRFKLYKNGLLIDQSGVSTNFIIDENTNFPYIGFSMPDGPICTGMGCSAPLYNVGMSFPYCDVTCNQGGFGPEGVETCPTNTPTPTRTPTPRPGTPTATRTPTPRPPTPTTPQGGPLPSPYIVGGHLDPDMHQTWIDNSSQIYGAGNVVKYIVNPPAWQHPDCGSAVWPSDGTLEVDCNSVIRARSFSGSCNTSETGTYTATAGCPPGGTPPPEDPPGCDSSQVAMSGSPNPVIATNNITFNVSGSQGSTFPRDVFSGGLANCGSWQGSWPKSKICTAETPSSYTWTHYWKNCDNEACQNPSPECSKTYTYTVNSNATATPTRTPTPVCNSVAISNFNADSTMTQSLAPAIASQNNLNFTYQKVSGSISPQALNLSAVYNTSQNSGTMSTFSNLVSGTTYGYQVTNAWYSHNVNTTINQYQLDVIWPAGTNVCSGSPSIVYSNIVNIPLYNPHGRARVEAANITPTPYPSMCRLLGWTRDQDADMRANTAVPLAVHVYKNGTFNGGGQFLTSTTASILRSGIGFGAGFENHGYDINFYTALTPTALAELTGSTAIPLYVYAINAAGTAGGNALISSVDANGVTTLSIRCNPNGPTLTPTRTPTPTATRTPTPTPTLITVSCNYPTIIPPSTLGAGQSVTYQSASFTSGWTAQIKHRSILHASITPAAPMANCATAPSCTFIPSITPGDTRLFVGLNLRKTIGSTEYICGWHDGWSTAAGLVSPPPGYQTCSNNCERLLTLPGSPTPTPTRTPTPIAGTCPTVANFTAGYTTCNPDHTAQARFAWTPATGATYLIQVSTDTTGNFSNPYSFPDITTAPPYFTNISSAGTPRWYRIRMKSSPSCTVPGSWSNYTNNPISRPGC